MFAVEEYVPNWYDFVEEFLELNLIVDHKHVRVFELEARKDDKIKIDIRYLITFSVRRCLNVSNESACPPSRFFN